MNTIGTLEILLMLLGILVITEIKWKNNFFFIIDCHSERARLFNKILCSPRRLMVGMCDKLYIIVIIYRSYKTSLARSRQNGRLYITTLKLRVCEGLNIKLLLFQEFVVFSGYFTFFFVKCKRSIQAYLYDMNVSVQCLKNIKITIYNYFL